MCKLSNNNCTPVARLVKRMKAVKRYTISFFVLLVILASPIFSFGQMVTERIKLNQLGFYPNATKIAIVTGEMPAGVFYITSSNVRDTIFKGVLSSEMQSTNSSTKTRVADLPP